MHIYRVTIRVDEEVLLKSVKDNCDNDDDPHNQCAGSVRSAIEHEFGWLEESGIELEKVEKLIYPDCGCNTDWEHDQHTVICDHCGKKVDEGEITEIEGKWTCDACYSRLYL